MRGAGRHRGLRALVVSLALAGLGAARAGAQLPDAETLLADLGFGADEVAQVEAGSFVPSAMRPSNERELVTAFAFLVKAQPGGALNLSAAEIAGFQALGASAGVPAVEDAVRAALLARVQAHQAQGLAGIAPYAREGGAKRSPAEDLRSATLAAKRLRSLVPAAYQAMLEYPNAKAPGMQESFRGSRCVAHGEPTFALTHSLYAPDGDARVVMQRQFYVSTGYDCEQAIVGLLPMQQGTLVVYANRTSTDQVTGFGGGMKCESGSKLLASQLQELYGKVRAAETGGR